MGNPLISLFSHDDARVSVDDIDFDVPRDSVPAFLTAIWSGSAHVEERGFPPSCTLKIAVPGEPVHRRPVPHLVLTPWLASIIG